MAEWDAERDLDEAVVRRVLAEQFPELDVDQIHPLATGWDNSVWIVNHELAFRFPRRAIALPGVEREIMVLPPLAPRLPLAIPVPTHVGHPGRHFPWPFFGAPFIAGREPAETRLDGRRGIVGSTLGRFLRVLHEPGLAAEWRDRLPRDPMDRARMALRVPRTAERLDTLASAGLWRVPAEARSILTEAAGLPEPDGLALVHGDFHVRHVLVDGAGVPTGIIDWGDVCIGDPAIDLSLYWSLLDSNGRSAFTDSYGAIPEVRLLRARVLALFLNAVLALYAAETGDGALRAEAIAGLNRTVRDSP